MDKIPKKEKPKIDKPNMSYILKIFDRSLDVSNYTDETSLYTMCRAWYANKPDQTDTTVNTEPDPPPKVQCEESDVELLEKLRKGEITTVYNIPLPPPSDLPIVPPIEVRKVPEEQSLTVFELFPDPKDGKATEKQEEPTKEELLALNMKKWKKIKKNWINYSRKRDERFKTTFEIIDLLGEMGKKAAK